MKVERLGNIITTYASPDGTSWAAQVVGRFDNMGAVPYVGIAVSSLVPGTLSTATFGNVSITGGNGAAPVAAPAAPLGVYASPGDRHVPLRWTESFGAVNYKVKRATTSGGPYTTIATVTGPSYVDETASNDTPYYYVISAANAVGEGANSPEDVVTPRVRLVNAAGSGTAFASANNGNVGDGPAKAFDVTTGSKWFNAGAGPTGWIRYDVGAGNAQAVVAYDLMSANDAPARDPRDWQFQGSNNGSTWTTLDTQVGQTFSYRQFPKRYHFTNTTVYRYYRLNITANNGDATGVQLSELSLLAAPKLGTSQFSYQTAPNEVRFAFNALPHFTVGDLSVMPLEGGSAIGSVGYSPRENTAVFRLNAPLPDGNYVAGLPGGYSFPFFVFAGDANHDRTVDSTDFVALAANFGGSSKTFGEGDFNYDDQVNTADFNILAGHFGTSLPAPAAAPLALGALQASASLFGDTDWNPQDLELLT